jgi:hypothetical protein
MMPSIFCSSLTAWLPCQCYKTEINIVVAWRLREEETLKRMEVNMNQSFLLPKLKMAKRFPGIPFLKK